MYIIGILLPFSFTAINSVRPIGHGNGNVHRVVLSFSGSHGMGWVGRESFSTQEPQNFSAPTVPLSYLVCMINSMLYS